ncbi:MAG: F0F1 ATP synthase subunit B [Candidatus Nomurabacteria bacterium]|jgi:F-type H+-transporting ATPase subunit b|nr:F0F1 ATP synthase subunit B [Candidatus Nomurabacteria bacterium]
MLNWLTHFANAAELESASGNFLDALGIDFQLLILQIIAFLILVFILAKFIYPQISAMLDRRDKVINDAIKAAKESEEKAAKSEAETAKILGTARKEAGEIVATAKKESVDIATRSEFEAKKKAEGIVRQTRDDLQSEVAAARHALRSEMLDLVAVSTEKVAAVKLGDDDRKLVEKTLEDGDD